MKTLPFPPLEYESWTENMFCLLIPYKPVGFPHHLFNPDNNSGCWVTDNDINSLPGARYGPIWIRN